MSDININIDKKDTKLLWNTYLEDPIIENRNNLVLNYYPYVRYIAKKILVSYNLYNVVELNDLVSYGIFGLIDAIDKYDVTKSTPFTSYASFRIKGAIIDELRKFDLIPRSIRTKVRNVKHIQLNHLVNTGEFLCISKIAESMSTSKIEYQQIVNTLSENTHEEYNSEVIESFNGYYSMDDDIDKLLIKDHVQQCISQLTKKQQSIIVMYYYEHKTLNEISDILNMSEPGVLLQKRKALSILHNILDKQLLSDVIPQNEEDTKTFILKNTKLKKIKKSENKSTPTFSYYKEAVI